MVTYRVMSCLITPRLTKYTNQYNSLLGKNNIDSINNTWTKELVLSKIILYIRDTELAGPGTVFMVGELKAVYAEMLDGHGTVCISICRASACKGSRVTQRVFKQQVEPVF